MSKEISFILPCLNEEKGIGICLDKINEVIDKRNLNAEIVVADNNSTDKSPQIARKKGARVVHQDIKGYGATYLKGLEEANGELFILGDADDTYDFKEAPKFIEALREDYDLVMGTRLDGNMKPGSMPLLNLMGNKFLTGMVRVLFQTEITDAHCGLRGFTREAYEKMDLETKGMEFASEIVIAAVKNDLKIKEIPITYYSRKGSSKLARFEDAWRHIKYILKAFVNKS